MKKIFLILAVCFSFTANAQFTKASVQASGLTCSMCSNAIHKALRTLDFVDKVDANIKNSSFDISFKTGSTVDIEKIRGKVEDAGFSVASFYVSVNFNGIKAPGDNCITYGSTAFYLLNAKEPVLNGEKKIRIMEKGFLSAKEYKKNAAIIKGDCNKAGEKPAKAYHAIIS